MKVLLYKSQIDRFRRLARNNKNEILAYLYGTRSLEEVQVHHFLYPELLEQTPTTVQGVYAAPTYKDFAFLGTIHSHPNAPPILSQSDWEGSLLDSEVISGVCEVRGRRTTVVWWTPHCALCCDWDYMPKGKE